MIDKMAFLIYAGRIAFVTIKKKQVFIIRSREIAAPLREQFKYPSDIGKKAWGRKRLSFLHYEGIVTGWPAM